MMDLEQLVRGVRGGDRRTLAKAITLVESTRPDHQDAAQRLLERLLPQTGAAVRVGITGVPGVGKSTFIEAFGLHLIAQGRRIAVLTVDPSSARTGGSILGDKTRMAKLSAAPAAFIRPSPSGGSLGGVARRTREAMLVCEAAGYDVVIVETADAIAINKADGDNLARAQHAATQYIAALNLFRHTTPTWSPPVVTLSALEMRGMDRIWSIIQDHRAKLGATGELAAKRREQQRGWFWSVVDEGIKSRFLARPEVRTLLTELEAAVVAGDVSPTAAARRVLTLSR